MREKLKKKKQQINEIRKEPDFYVSYETNDVEYNLPEDMICPCGGDIWRIRKDDEIIYKCGHCQRIFRK